MNKRNLLYFITLFPFLFFPLLAFILSYHFVHVVLVLVLTSFIINTIVIAILIFHGRIKFFGLDYKKKKENLLWFLFVFFSYLFGLLVLLSYTFYHYNPCTGESTLSYKYLVSLSDAYIYAVLVFFIYSIIRFFQKKKRLRIIQIIGIFAIMTVLSFLSYQRRFTPSRDSICSDNIPSVNLESHL